MSKDAFEQFNSLSKAPSLYFKEAYEASPAIVREAALLATSLPACLLHGAEESLNDPKGTFDRAVSAVGIGVALGLITRRPRAILKLAGECRVPLAKDLANNARTIVGIKTAGIISAHALGTVPFLIEAAQPERLKAVSSAISDTWHSNKVDTLYQSRDKVANNWGRFVFDSVAMLPLAKTGDYLGVKAIDSLRRAPHAPQFALASTFNSFPVRAKAEEPLIDNTLNMVAQETAPHKKPGTVAHKTYTEFQETLGKFGEIRSSVGDLQKRNTNINEAKDLWIAAHELIKTVLAAKTGKKAYDAALDQMAAMNKKLTALLDGKPIETKISRANDAGHTRIATRQIDTAVQRVLPKAIMDAKLTDTQLKTYESFVKTSRSISSDLEKLGLSSEEAQGLAKTVKTAVQTITALAGEVQNPAKRKTLDTCLDNLAIANKVIDGLKPETFAGREMQVKGIGKLLNSHISNLDQELSINFEKAVSPKTQLKALSLYADLIEQIALKTIAANEGGHKYETQVTKQIHEALKASDDHKVFVSAQSYSPADSTRFDGIFIDLAHNKVMPVDFGLANITIANKLAQGKGLWALHIPQGKPQQTLEYLKRFEDGTYLLDPLRLAINKLPRELAKIFRHKMDINELQHLESKCKTVTEQVVVMEALQQLSNAAHWHVMAKKRALESLNGLLQNRHTNEELKLAINDYLNGKHYQKELSRYTPNCNDSSSFIKDETNLVGEDAFRRLFLDNPNCLLWAGELLGLKIKGQAFEPPMYDLSMFHNKLGEGTSTALPLPQFRFDPLAAAQQSTMLIKHYESFVQNNPNNSLGQYLLKCAKEAESHRESVSQIGSALAVGLASNKLGALRNGRSGSNNGNRQFTTGTDYNGEYHSYDLTPAARQSLKQSALNGDASQAQSIRIYKDGSVRLMYTKVKNGAVSDASYELGPFEYWNQLADALVRKTQPAGDVTLESHGDQSRNLLSLVEALETGLPYEHTALAGKLFNELQTSGWLKDGKSHTENAPVSKPKETAKAESSQGRTSAYVAGKGVVEIAYSKRIPEDQFKESLDIYQRIKIANLMTIRLPDMRPPGSSKPADRAFTLLTKERSYNVFESDSPNGIEVVVITGSKLLSRFRIAR